MTTKDQIKKIIEDALVQLKAKGDVLVEYPRERIRGDYSSNVAFIFAKNCGINPLKAAMLLKTEIEKNHPPAVKKIEVVSGFINFFISEAYLQKEVSGILKQKAGYGSLKLGKNKKANVEFVSANPTGPLTLGNGRGGFSGDVLANVLAKAGYKVSREYYINDTGAQIKKLGHSVIGDTEAVYKGEYIANLRRIVPARLHEDSSRGVEVEKVGEKAAKIILEKMIKPSVKKMDIKFDTWFSEKELYKKKEVDRVIRELSERGFTYEREGALWFKSHDLGDDKDRVLIRADGIKTYFASDVAYLKNKLKRGFDKVIIFLGADHYGYVARLKVASHALGFSKDTVEAIVMQLVRLFEKGKEVRMSKRTGIYVTIDELIDRVGLDAARFFFLMIGPNTHLNFNLDLAKERSEKNPVFRIQYAHARISSILRLAKNSPRFTISSLQLLQDSAEIDLMVKLAKLPEIVSDISKDYQIQRLPQYALEISESFHKFYEKCRVLDPENKDTTKARIALITATGIVLKNTLELMRISAPEKM